MTNARVRPLANAVPEESGVHAASPAQVEAEISLSSDSNFFADLTGDVSTGGLFVATYRALPRGRIVELHLLLPDGLLVTRGEVWWSRDPVGGAPAGIAFRLPALAPEDCARIIRFCRARAPLYYDPDLE